ncbi:MAG: hypothetical protein ACQEQF_05940 [Bacillota bacterium]
MFSMLETFMWNDAHYRVLPTNDGGIIHIDNFKYESENIVYHKVSLMIDYYEN